MTEFHPLRKAMIVIAVSDYAPPFNNLPGTITSANRIANWAEGGGDGRGYDVLKITDEKEPGSTEARPVTVKRLQDEIGAFLSTRPYIIERLVIYFAGHGLMRSSYDQFWLLTNAGDDTRQGRREGVDVLAFIEELKCFGIGRGSQNLVAGQLCVIADACRDSNQASPRFRGDEILIGPSEPDNLQVDMFMATTLGHYAFQPTAVEDGGAPYCLFTDVLCDALEGKVPDVIEKVYHPWSPVIQNDLLAQYLIREVPKRAAAFGEDMRPDIKPGLMVYHNYYDILDGDGGDGDGDTLVSVGGGGHDAPDAARRLHAHEATTLRFQPEDTNMAALDYFRLTLDSMARSVVAGTYGTLIVANPGQVALPAGIRDRVAASDGALRWRPEQALAGLPFFVRQQEGWTLAPPMPGTVTALHPMLPGEVFLNDGGEDWDMTLSSTWLNATDDPPRLGQAETYFLRVEQGGERGLNAANVAGYLYYAAGDRDGVLRVVNELARQHRVSCDLAMLAATDIRWQQVEGRWQAVADFPPVPELADADDLPAMLRAGFPALTDVPLTAILPVHRQGWRMMRRRNFATMPPILREMASQASGFACVVLPDDAMQELAIALTYEIFDFSPG